ncbi:MAG: hypothetical protein V1833_05520 [Elusimicrobiota bacterium]
MNYELRIKNFTTLILLSKGTPLEEKNPFQLSLRGVPMKSGRRSNLIIEIKNLY